MGAIYYIECLEDRCLCGVQIGKRFGKVSAILTEEEMDKLYEGKSLGVVGGKHEGDTGAIMDAIEGTDWFEYRRVPKKLLLKIRDGYQKSLETEKQEVKTEWGWWNDARSLHDFYKDVIEFIDTHKDHKVGWQDNGHLFGSRGLPTFHHKAHKIPKKEEL